MWYFALSAVALAFIVGCFVGLVFGIAFANIAHTGICGQVNSHLEKREGQQ